MIRRFSPLSLMLSFSCCYMPETPKGKELRLAADGDAVLTAGGVSADAQAAIKAANDAAIRAELGLGTAATHDEVDFDKYDHIEVTFADSPVTALPGKYYHADLTDGSISFVPNALAGLVEGNKIGIKIKTGAGANVASFNPNGAETVNEAANFDFGTEEESHEFEVGADKLEWMVKI